LGLDVRVLGRIGPDVDLGDRTVLRCLAARPAGDPAVLPIRPTEHDQLRWLPAGELDGVDWLDADRTLIPHLRALLNGQASDGQPPDGQAPDGPTSDGGTA
jgi:8-oxo-dGTP diphosphatase